MIAVAIVRDPSPRTFILGLAASTLIWFGFLTQMHERYAYGALVFLLLLIPERRIQWLCVALGVVFTLNLWSAAPPTPIFRVWLPYPGLHSMVGAVIMLAITGLTIIWASAPPGGVSDSPDHRVPVASGVPSV